MVSRYYDLTLGTVCPITVSFPSSYLLIYFVNRL